MVEDVKDTDDWGQAYTTILSIIRRKIVYLPGVGRYKFIQGKLKQTRT